MSVALLTESEARRQWSGNMLVVREDRTLIPDFAVIGLRCMALALVSLPFWSKGILFMEDIPALVALLGAGWCVFRSFVIAADLKAARAPSSWLFAASREKVWVHFRSYLHHEWSAVDKTVFAMERTDIDHLCALAGPDGSKIQLAIRLEQPLPPEFIEALMIENTRADGVAFRRPRHAHEPVRLEKNLCTLRILFGNTIPSFTLVRDKLRLDYRVDPARSVADLEAGLLPDEPA